MEGDDVPSGLLSSWTRLEAGLALLSAAAAAGWICLNAPYVSGFGVACAALFAVPLLAATKRAFVIGCLVIAGLFVPLSILGVFLGLFLFLPAALVLIASAGLVAHHRGLRATARIVAWTVALSVLIAFGVAFNHHFSPPPNIIVVQEFAPGQDYHLVMSLSTSIYKSGFSGVGVSTSSRNTQLNVGVPDSMAQQTRQRLLRFVRAQPGVMAAYWCQGTRCNG